MTEKTLKATERNTGKRASRLSKDGNWRSFPKVPHLLQYVPSETYYGRIKVKGKLVRESLETTVWSTALLKLWDFLKEQNNRKSQGETLKFSEALDLYQKKLESDPKLKPLTREYRKRCINKIRETWPGIENLRLNEISEHDCREWAARISREIASQYYNNTIGTLRQIIDIGVKECVRQGVRGLENPAWEISRVTIQQKELKLPDTEQFKAMLENVQKKSGGWGPRVADLIQFLAFSGMRVRSEAQWVTWDDIDWQRNEIIVRGHPETGTKNREIRRIPIIPDMAQLLQKMAAERSDSPSGRVLEITRCHETLERACKEIGIPRITHHDLRHLFATRCIESGVDIPTVARWLGHKDGGALAMKVYGHLRNEHSQEMAKKVRF